MPQGTISALSTLRRETWKAASPAPRPRLGSGWVTTSSGKDPPNILGDPSVFDPPLEKGRAVPEGGPRALTVMRLEVAVVFLRNGA